MLFSISQQMWAGHLIKVDDGGRYTIVPYFRGILLYCDYKEKEGLYSSNV